MARTPLLLIGEKFQEYKPHQYPRYDDICKRHQPIDSGGEKQNVCGGGDKEEQDALCQRNESDIKYEEEGGRKLFAEHIPFGS
jgi:hypothetical protein